MQITYKLPFGAFLLKPVVVGGVTFSLFILALIIKRIDSRIMGDPIAETKKKQ